MECPWVARARTRPCVAEDEDQITLAKGDRVRVERHCPESQTAFVAFSCAAGIIRGLVPLSLLEPVDAEEGASEGEPSQGGVDDELDMFRAQLGHGELQTTRAADSDDEVDDDFEELIKDVEDAREEAVAVEQTPSRAAASDATDWSRPPFWLMERIATATLPASRGARRASTRGARARRCASSRSATFGRAPPWDRRQPFRKPPTSSASGCRPGAAPWRTRLSPGCRRRTRRR